MSAFRQAGISFVVASLCLVGSCRDSLSVPPRLSATYVLERINGQTLPAVASEGGGFRYVVLADSLFFDANGKVRRAYTYQLVRSGASPSEATQRESVVLPYDVDGARLTIGFRGPCPPNANCVGFEEGTINADFVRLSSSLFWSGGPEFLFRRR